MFLLSTLLTSNVISNQLNLGESVNVASGRLWIQKIVRRFGEILAVSLLMHAHRQLAHPLLFLTAASWEEVGCN